MSAELEMLRKMAGERLTGALAQCPKCGVFCDVDSHPDERSVDVFDLRAILARLEAAERVCESCFTEQHYNDMAGSYDAEMRYDEDALRAYRALDGKGEG